jgi:hypothetical protein
MRHAERETVAPSQRLAVTLAQQPGDELGSVAFPKRPALKL